MRQQGERSWRDDLRWGLDWGLTAAKWFSAIALVQFVLALALLLPGLFGTDAPARWRVLTPALLAFPVYVVGGVSGGAILGLLRGLLVNWLGAVIVGMLATLPASFAFVFGLTGSSDWGVEHTWFAVGFAAFWGACMSSALWWTRDRHSDDGVSA